mgnify:CR=1 FL=1
MIKIPNGAGGTGESRVNGFCKEKYCEPCEPEVLASVFCSYYGVPEPVLHKLPLRRSGRWGGRYTSKTHQVAYTIEWTGLVIHELAHHIDRMLNKNSKDWHGEEFSRILQEMVDYWR